MPSRTAQYDEHAHKLNRT